MTRSNARHLLNGQCLILMSTSFAYRLREQEAKWMELSKNPAMTMNGHAGM
jgi:hypothetical protein